MKSNELFEQIHSGQIKDNTKISVINELTENYITEIEYKNQRLNWISGEFDTSFLCNIDIDFEIIEENKEIEELNDTNYFDNMTSKDKEYYFNLTRKRLNEVIRTVNKLNKEREQEK